MKTILLALLVTIAAPSFASAQDGPNHIYLPTPPEGGEIERTTSDPGWWQRTFVGWDANGDGKYTGGERGVLIMAWDAIVSIFTGIGNYMLDLVWASIPNDWRVGVEPMLGYIKIANTWLPLDFMLSLYFAYYTFSATFSVFRWTLKFIPFIG
jgi:hypothetical protein